MEKRRVFYLDALRVASVLAVMLLHVSAQNWGTAPVQSLAWQTFNAVNGLSRWGAPVFVMISGALMLGRPHAPRALGRKILRLAAAFLFWSAVYAALERHYEGLSLGQTLLQLASGHYHMWFLYMIAALYLLVPLLGKLVESRRLTEYFLVLALLFNFALPQGIGLLSLVSPALSGAAEAILAKGYVHFPLGFTGFFVLGYYLSVTDIPKRARGWIYALGLGGFVSTAAFTALLSLRQGAADGRLLTYFSLNVLAECLGVFVLFKYALPGAGERVRRLFAALSDRTFGAYLVHILFLDLLRRVLGVDTLSFSPFLSVPLIALTLFAASYAASFALGKLPVAGRIIV